MASGDQTATTEESYITSQKELIQLIQQRVPVFAHMLATKLDRWLPIWFHNQAGVAVPKELIPDRELGHFGPDNPLVIQPDGAARHHEFATLRHLQQLRDYNRSFKPSGRVGRPPENIELAERAYRCIWMARITMRSGAPYSPIRMHMTSGSGIAFANGLSD